MAYLQHPQQGTHDLHTILRTSNTNICLRPIYF